MIVHYANGTTRFIRPSSEGTHVQIWDGREDGFIGPPAHWEQGAGKLENDDSEQEAAAL